MAPINGFVCYDSKTGLYHQVQVRSYNSEYGDDEWEKIFEDMVCFCISENGKIVERIYIFPLVEVKRVKSISIYKNPSKGGQQNEQYRITNKDELNKANEILTQILKKRKKKGCH